MTTRELIKPTLVLMAGLSGAGKTTLALALGRSLRWPVLDKDTLKSPLLRAGLGESLATSTAYDVLFEMAWDLLVRQRSSVILDTPARLPFILDRARELTRVVEGDLKVILCLSGKTLRKRRLDARPAHTSHLSIALVDAEDDLLSFEHLPPDTFMVHTDAPLKESIAAALAFLRS